MEDKNEYKGYTVYFDGMVTRIKARGQGTVPKPLRGGYTKKVLAHAAVDTYLNSLKKGKSNGKTVRNSTG